MESNVVVLPSVKEILDGKNGWEIVAGQDVQKNRLVTRYLLAINRAPNTKDRAAILSTKNTRTDWFVAHLGRPANLAKMFEQFDVANELR
jgi:hypothetical protein